MANFITREMKRHMLIRSRAKAFANELLSEGWALFIPEADAKEFNDEEMKVYLNFLKCNPLIQQRSDFRWEKKQ